jgi:hypothetical protein
MSRRAVGLAACFILGMTLTVAAGDAASVLAPYLRARDEGRTDAVTGDALCRVAPARRLPRRL